VFVQRSIYINYQLKIIVYRTTSYTKLLYCYVSLCMPVPIGLRVLVISPTALAKSGVVSSWTRKLPAFVLDWTCDKLIALTELIFACGCYVLLLVTFIAFDFQAGALDALIHLAIAMAFNFNATLQRIGNGERRMRTVVTSFQDYLSE